MVGKKRFVVYTVITGGFDFIKQPKVIDERFDYILFTDNVKESNIGVWSIQKINYTHKDTRVQSRYPKIYPTKVLSEYQASLYIDGNIQITSQYVYDRCVDLYDNGVEWASIKHQGRDGLYNEIKLVGYLRFSNPKDIDKVMDILKDCGYNYCRKKSDYCIEIMYDTSRDDWGVKVNF